jgi:hypothetical protein
LPNLPTDPTPEAVPASKRAAQLAQIVDMLSKAPAVRSDLVADIRSQVDGGGYLSEEKLDLAIYRMLKDILE